MIKYYPHKILWSSTILFSKFIYLLKISSFLVYVFRKIEFSVISYIFTIETKTVCVLLKMNNLGCKNFIRGCFFLLLFIASSKTSLVWLHLVNSDNFCLVSYSVLHRQLFFIFLSIKFVSVIVLPKSVSF